MEDKNQSAWAKAFSFQDQKTIIKRLLPYTKPYKKYFITAFIFAFGLAVVNVVLPQILQYYMDNVLTSKNVAWNVILAFAGLYFLGVMVKALTQFIQLFAFSMGAEYTLEAVRVALFKKLHRLGLRYFDNTPTGSIVSRVTNDTKTLFDFWNLFLTIAVALLSMLTAFVAMLSVNLTISLATLLFVPVILTTTYVYQKISSKIYRTIREALSKINTKINESLLGMGIIQQFNQEERILGEFDEINGYYAQRRAKMININSFFLFPIVTLMYSLAEIVVLSVFGIETQSNIFVEAGVIYAFLTYVQNFFNPLSNVMDFMPVFQDGLVAGYRILKIMDDDRLAPQQAVDETAQITEGKIEFKNVTFAYDKTPILKNITFTALPGQTVALVGHTGSGKSSIINVLLRFYEYMDGEILIDGHDLRTFSHEELRQKTGLVLQDPFLFYGDIASNIRMFDQKISDEQVQAAAKFVRADEFIEKLDGKYHAKVSERGTTYSNGQRQLLAFARTIVRDPKVLILDEATSNIDPQTEEAIQNGLNQMRQGRTTIAIAHRLSTIKDADLILVLDKGEIVERGNHEQLLAQGGYYADLYQMQLAKE
ncbi:ABC transporter ATP-binding protein [Ligilactobacillus equi]